jgi:4-amino-4-deoxy-L-arabinose transferase-like glycosyltransferase
LTSARTRHWQLQEPFPVPTMNVREGVSEKWQAGPVSNHLPRLEAEGRPPYMGRLRRHARPQAERVVSRLDKLRLRHILLVAFLLRAVIAARVLASGDEYLAPDSSSYRDAAAAFSATFINTEANDSLALRRTPGYPAFLWFADALGAPVVAALVAQVLAGVLSVAIIYYVGLEVTGHTGGASAALLLSLSPAHIVFSSYLLTECIFLLFLTGGLACLHAGWSRPNWPLTSLGSGLLGLSALIRPASLYLAVVFILFASAAWALRAGPRWAAAAIFLPGALAVGGWYVHNYNAYGAWTFTSISSINLLEYRAAPALANHAGISVYEAKEKLRQLTSQEADGDLNAANVARDRSAVAVRSLQNTPREAAVNTVEGAVRLLFSPVREAVYGFGYNDEDALATAAVIVLCGLNVLWLLALYALAALSVRPLWARHDRVVTVCALVIITYFVAVSAGPEARDPRLRLPILPAITLLAGVAIATRCPSIPEHA